MGIEQGPSNEEQQNIKESAPEEALSPPVSITDNTESIYRSLESADTETAIELVNTSSTLDRIAAESLIESGHLGAECVVSNIKKLQGISKEELVDKLIEHSLIYALLRKSEVSKEFDMEQIVEKLYSTGQLDEIANFLYLFPQVDQKDLAQRMLDSGQMSQVAALTSTFDRFFEEGVVDPRDIMNKLIEIGRVDYLVNNIRSLGRNLDQKQIALHLIDLGFADPVARGAQFFKGLDQEVKNRLLELGYQDAVERQYPEVFGS